MGRLRLEGVVVQRAHLLERAVLGVAQIEDGPHAAVAEVGRHLGLGVVARLRVPGGSLLRQLLLGLQRIAAARSPVRMDVDDLHELCVALVVMRCISAEARRAMRLACSSPSSDIHPQCVVGKEPIVALLDPGLAPFGGDVVLGAAARRRAADCGSAARSRPSRRRPWWCGGGAPPRSARTRSRGRRRISQGSAPARCRPRSPSRRPGRASAAWRGRRRRGG